MGMEVPVKVLYGPPSKAPVGDLSAIPWWWFKLSLAMELTVTFPACGHMECLLRQLLSELTTDAPSEPWAVQYRRDYQRSLYVGDVVTVGETAWKLTESGWQLTSLQADDFWAPNGLSRMRRHQSYTNKWHGDWRAFTRANVALACHAGRMAGLAPALFYSSFRCCRDGPAQTRPRLRDNS